MRIGDRASDAAVIVVAEVGNNHEGDIGRARELVERAADAKADVVKFQTFRTEWFTSAADPARVARLKRFELSFEAFAELATLARKRGLGFMSTPLDLESARFLLGICDAIKIASGDNDYWDLLGVAASSELPLIVSSGMTSLNEIRRTVAFVRELRRDRPFAVLHCVSAYPAPESEVNLRAIGLLEAELGCPIGYSDHTLGFDACTTAVALGARVVEKHFTLDKSLSDFRDHQLSADPAELAELVARIRRVETLLGSPSKTIQPAERNVATVARRSAAAAKRLGAGHVIEASDIVFLRPGTGIRPGGERELIGKRLRKDVAFGTLLSVEDVV